MGSAVGARKTAARRIGVTLTEYDAHLAAGEKWCRAHSTWHPRTEFHVDTSRGDGLTPVCARARIRAVGPHPGRTERRAAATRGEAWCRGCAAWLSYADVRQGKCIVHRRAEGRATYARNSVEVRSRKNARKRGLATIPAWWAQEHQEKFDGLCAYGCGRAGMAMDHVWPVARGGESRPGNLVPTCTTCNSKKKDHDPADWVMRGIEAFPDQWCALECLAREHGSDDWVETLERFVA